jgi:hypothetical protein
MHNFSTSYFNSVFAGYTFGLALTIVVMNVFNAAQPALLYIVPAVLGAVALHAWQRKELNKVGLIHFLPACKPVTHWFFNDVLCTRHAEPQLSLCIRLARRVIWTCYTLGQADTCSCLCCCIPPQIWHFSEEAKEDQAVKKDEGSTSSEVNEQKKSK